MKLYEIPVPKDPVAEGNYKDDVVTDKDGNQTITKKARDKISYSEKKILTKRLQTTWKEREDLLGTWRQLTQLYGDSVLKLSSIS